MRGRSGFQRATCELSLQDCPGESALHRRVGYAVAPELIRITYTVKVETVVGNFSKDVGLGLRSKH